MCKLALMSLPNIEFGQLGIMRKVPLPHSDQVAPEGTEKRTYNPGMVEAAINTHHRDLRRISLP